jgi:Leucine-rich repeat (LRR) protein
MFQITVIPNGVEDLQVTELNINQNQISSIAVSLAECPKLKTLRIEENCLALNSIPTELLSKSKISSFHWAGNLFDERQLSELEGYSHYMERYTAVRRKLD